MEINVQATERKWLEYRVWLAPAGTWCWEVWDSRDWSTTGSDITKDAAERSVQSRIDTWKHMQQDIEAREAAEVKRVWV